MKTSHLLAAAFVGATAVVPQVASAAAYEIDAVHSSAQFAIKHMMVATVRGEFSKVSGTVNLDDNDLKAASVEATIDPATINTRNSKRDDHLRSPDFFDVAKFPAITFKSTSVKKVSEGKYKVAGTLNMHGVGKAVVLDVVAPKTEVKGPGGVMKRGATATTRLERKDFGLHWNKTLEAGGVMVSDTVDVTIELELDRKDATTAAR